MPEREQRKLRLLRAAQESRAGGAVRGSRALEAAADARLEISRRAAQRWQVARSVVVGPKCPVSGFSFEGDSLEATRRGWRETHSPWAADAGALRCDHPARGRVPAFRDRLSSQQHVVAVRPEKSFYLGVRYRGPKEARGAAGGAPAPDLVELPSVRTLKGHPVWLRVVERRAAGFHTIEDGPRDCPEHCGAGPFFESSGARRHWGAAHFRPGAPAPLARALRVIL